MGKGRLMLGVMSGSSLDGLDLALCRFSGKGVSFEWKVLDTACVDIPERIRAMLRQIPNGSALELAKADFDFGYFIGDVCSDFLKGRKVDYIASHGHTVFHYPEKRFTCQIGHGAAISISSGFPVINDFRTSDVASGGQGAPIVSTFDKLLLSHIDVLINLGGIANVTINKAESSIAYDICPCNQLLNYLAGQLGRSFDEKGALASTGQINVELLDALLKVEYHQRSYPKSLDNTQVGQNYFILLDRNHDTVINKLSTAVAFISQMVKNEIEKETVYNGKHPIDVMLTGGGAHNVFLLDVLKKRMPQINWIVPDTEFIDFKEAIMIAFLGYLRSIEETNVFCGISGANMNTINGAIYKACNEIC